MLIDWIQKYSIRMVFLHFPHLLLLHQSFDGRRVPSVLRMIHGQKLVLRILRTFATVVYVVTWNGSGWHRFLWHCLSFSIASICEATRDCAYSTLHGCGKKPFGQQRYQAELRCIPLSISIWSNVILPGGFSCPYF